MKQRVRNEICYFLLALQFMTRIPIPDLKTIHDQAFMRSVAYYPFVGVVIGSIIALIFFTVSAFLPLTITGFLTVLSTILITGGLHEDGLADILDGFGGGRTSDHTLAIMRDSRLGTYGVIGLVISIILHGYLIISLPTGVIAWALIAGHMISRYSIVLLIATSRYARPEGAGFFLANGISHHVKWFSFSFTVVATLLLALLAGLWSFLSAALVAILTMFIMRQVFIHKIQGYTGDCLGAVQQITFMIFLLVVVACL